MTCLGCGQESRGMTPDGNYCSVCAKNQRLGVYVRAEPLFEMEKVEFLIERTPEIEAGKLFYVERKEANS